jgi:hypothetical protein
MTGPPAEASPDLRHGPAKPLGQKDHGEDQQNREQQGVHIAYPTQEIG